MQSHLYLPPRSSIRLLMLSKKSINSMCSFLSPKSFLNYQLRIGVDSLNILGAVLVFVLNFLYLA